MQIGDFVRVIGGSIGNIYDLDENDELTDDCYHQFNIGDLVQIIGFDGDYVCQREDGLIQKLFKVDIEYM